MRQSISIDNHSGFHFTVLRTSLAGGLLGLLHGLVAPSTSYFADPAGLSGSWSFFYGASAVALLGGAAVLPVRSSTSNDVDAAPSSKRTVQPVSF